VISGTKTSFFSSPIGTAFAKDIIEKRARRRAKKEVVVVNCIIEKQQVFGRLNIGSRGRIFIHLKGETA